MSRFQVMRTPQIENAKRALQVDELVERFQTVTGSEDSEALTDLLCDLMHWADLTGNEFETHLKLSRIHYKAEIKGDL